MSCESPFEYEISSELIESEFVFQMSGVCKIPALTIPSFSVYEAVLPTWECTSSWNCTTKKVCSKVWKKWCWSNKSCPLKTSCVWEKGGWCCPWTIAAIPVFPSFNLPMTAIIPFSVSAGAEVLVTDLGVGVVQIAEFTIYQKLPSDPNVTFKLTFNFGEGLIFDFWLPPDFECTVTEVNGEFSLTIPLYNFGTFASYPADSGFTYSLTMSINLLFCLGEAKETESWLMLQVISETEITGDGIKPYTLPINFSIPLLTAG
jgi:hypothetical protein